MQRISLAVPIFCFTVHTEPKEITEIIPTVSANTETARMLLQTVLRQRRQFSSTTHPSCAFQLPFWFI